MDYARAAERLRDLPLTDPERGKLLYDWVMENRPRDILEIGFYHGASTCYMAAALNELGPTHRIVTIDLESAHDREPSLEQLAAELGLSDHIEPIYAERSFTWELWRMLDRQPRPQFDLVFHDAFHTWDTVGFGFFLADKLLRQGGWMLFDDMKWTIDRLPPERRGMRGAYPEEERTTPAVAEAYRLLVQEHPSYGSFMTTRKGTWGWARKERTA